MPRPPLSWQGGAPKVTEIAVRESPAGTHRPVSATRLCLLSALDAVHHPIMSKVLIILAGVVLTAVVGGAIYLATFDPPVTRERVEQVLPNDRFPE